MDVIHYVDEVYNAIEKLYQSMSIYHAFFVVDSNPSPFDVKLIEKMTNDFPIVYWQQKVEYINKYRLLVVTIDDLQHFAADIDMFTLAMTSNSVLFEQLLNHPLCEKLTILNFSCMIK